MPGTVGECLNMRRDHDMMVDFLPFNPCCLGANISFWNQFLVKHPMNFNVLDSGQPYHGEFVFLHGRLIVASYWLCQGVFGYIIWFVKI